jgi:penicillin-binding protein 1A
MNRERFLALVYRVADRVRWPLGPYATLGIGAAALLVAALLWGNCGLTGCPDVGRLAAYQPDGAPVLLDRNGKQFGNLAPFERRVVPLDSLPDYVAKAFVAVEDKRFFDHNGVDWRRAFGAALVNVRARGVSQGFSTISMQLARNVFPKQLPGQERTLRRKLLEIRVAKAIEHRFSKDEILEMYLNHIYFGGGAYGIETASRHYFGKSAKKLLLSEAATLAALPKAPAHYDPRRHPERSTTRRAIVLGQMLDQGMITESDAEGARNAKLRVPAEAPSGSSESALGAYFIDVIRSMLDEKFGDELYSSRLRIYTTLDATAERAAEEELDRQLRSLSGQVRKGDGPLQGSVVVMEAATGDVLALVGGRDHRKSRYNRAVLASRQVGSAFKPFVYATAIQEGFYASQILEDTPYQLVLSRGNVWEPKNYDGSYEGGISLRNALVRSRNIPTVRLASMVGYDKIETLAHSAGVSSDIPDQPSMALGVASMSPLELATAYTPFATLGMRAKPRFLVRVESEDGRVLWEPPAPPAEPALDPKVAYITTDMLRDVVDRGTGAGVRSAGFRGPAAGKTGTTNDATDAWFIGYTPDLVADIWIGYDTPSPISTAATGGGLAAPVWGRIMRRIYSERPTPPAWSAPAGVVERSIDPMTGLVLEEGCLPEYGEARGEVFLVDHIPESSCPSRGDWFSDFFNDIGQRIEGIFSRPDPDDQVREQQEQARRRESEMEKFLEKRREQLEKKRDQLERERARDNRGRGRGNDR